MRVLVTRPQGQAASWVQRLRERGVDAYALPLIGIAPAADLAAVQAAWHRLGDYRLVTFVSPNAVEHFFAARPREAGWPSVRAASPGPGTSDALLQAGVSAEQVVAPPPDAAQFDSEALWQVLANEDWQGARVLIVRGGEGAEGSGREWLANTLARQGAEVEFVAAYRRVPPAWDAAADALLQQAVASPAEYMWLFSSSEAIAHLQAHLQASQLTPPDAAWSACATHPRIAKTAQAVGFGRVLESAPAFDDVLACITAAGKVPSIQSIEDSHPVLLPASTVTETATSAPAVVDPPPSSAGPAERKAAWVAPVVVAAVLAVAASLWLAWSAQQRVQSLEQELVRRQQDSQGEATEARVLAKQAQDVSREAAAKAALLEARVAEVALQRGQLEELIQSLSRSRDENLVVDIEAGLRVALQQTAITGSAEPLVAALRSADERLVRVNQPRLEGVRRAIARDLDRVKAVGVADISTLVIKLDEAVRLVDDMPLLSTASDGEAKPGASAPSAKSQRGAGSARSAASAPASPASAAAGWQDQILQLWRPAWQELRSLVRVTRIDAPEAMLIAPEQGFFLRENLKLKLLNARLALLSRQFDTAQSDLQAASAALGRYFDGSSRKTAAAAELMRQVAAQSRQGGVPRPDDTLAALAAAAAGR